MYYQFPENFPGPTGPVDDELHSMYRFDDLNHRRQWDNTKQHQQIWEAAPLSPSPYAIEPTHTPSVSMSADLTYPQDTHVLPAGLHVQVVPEG